MRPKAIVIVQRGYWDKLSFLKFHGLAQPGAGADAASPEPHRSA